MTPDPEKEGNGCLVLFGIVAFFTWIALLILAFSRSEGTGRSILQDWLGN